VWVIGHLLTVSFKICDDVSLESSLTENFKIQNILPFMYTKKNPFRKCAILTVLGVGLIPLDLLHKQETSEP
jgi:hypothetical protein